MRRLHSATGSPLWQFRSELAYYAANKPDWYLAGRIDYRALMLDYPRQLFTRTGYPGWIYFEHGWLFYLWIPAAVWALRRGGTVVVVFTLLVIMTFLFLEFYPQYLTPYYLPLVRQNRYVQLLLPAAAVVAGAALAAYARTTIVPAGGCLAVDVAAELALRFYLYESAADVRPLKGAGERLRRAAAPLATIAAPPVFRIVRPVARVLVPLYSRASQLEYSRH